MKQTASFISTYTADSSGICSALYELGGMTIIHDASGCNSTYNTHDEPRWYDMDSMMYITGLSEMEALMGDDEKHIGDIVSAAIDLNPNFIALTGSPIPMMTGTDFKALSKVIEKRTGIPTFGFDTNGMHSYIAGISMAFKAFAERMTNPDVAKTQDLSVNIIGLTPLDFSVTGYVDSIKQAVIEGGFKTISYWAMGDTLENISKAGMASVNLVVSYDGLAAAKVLQEKFGTPYVVGVPVGTKFTKKVIADLKLSAEDLKNRVAYSDLTKNESDIVIIGESVMAGSLAMAIMEECGEEARILCPLETDEDILSQNGVVAEDEDDIVPHLQKAKTIIADPLYKPICPQSSKLIELPHEAFSGRIFRKDIVNLVDDFNKIEKEI